MSKNAAKDEIVQKVLSGDEEGFRQLCEHFLPLLTRRLRNLYGRTGSVDPSGAALSALWAVCKKILDGAYNGEELGAWLLRCAVWKAKNQLRRARAQRRGEDRTLRETDLGPKDQRGVPTQGALASVVGREAPADELAMFSEFMDRLDPELRHIALRKMEGASAETIAREVQRGEETVRRRILRIRSIWRDFADERSEEGAAG